MFTNFLRTSFLVLILAMIGSACSAPQMLHVAGHYKSCNASFVEKYRIGYDLKDAIDLQLAKDSTYTYTTCASIITGHWEKKGDAVLLWCTLNLQKVGDKGTLIRIDTLSCGNAPISLEIKDGQLWETLVINHKKIPVPYCRQ